MAAKKELKKRSRLELLELLVQQMEENEILKEENERLKKEAEQRRIAIETSGTLAEACLKLSGIFEAADRAVSLYRQNLNIPGNTEEGGVNEGD